MSHCGNPECSCSTGIHEGLTFGSGELDDWGYWSKPCQVCARANDAKQKETRAKIAKELSARHSKRYVRTYIARSAWLWLKSWPYPLKNVG
jgi:hypothetical protein